jgi:hypothetical protein
MGHSGFQASCHYIIWNGHWLLLYQHVSFLCLRDDHMNWNQLCWLLFPLQSDLCHRECITMMVRWCWISKHFPHFIFAAEQRHLAVYSSQRGLNKRDLFYWNSYCEYPLKFKHKMMWRSVSWDATQYTPLKVNRRFGGTCHRTKRRVITEDTIFHNHPTKMMP